MTAYNIDNIGIKAMVKKTAKQTGHTLLEDYKIVDNSKGKNEAEANINIKEKDERTEEPEKNEAKKKDKWQKGRESPIPKPYKMDAILLNKLMWNSPQIN